MWEQAPSTQSLTNEVGQGGSVQEEAGICWGSFSAQPVEQSNNMRPPFCFAAQGKYEAENNTQDQIRGKEKDSETWSRTKRCEQEKREQMQTKGWDFDGFMTQAAYLNPRDNVANSELERQQEDLQMQEEPVHRRESKAIITSTEEKRAVTGDSVQCQGITKSYTAKVFNRKLWPQLKDNEPARRPNKLVRVKLRDHQGVIVRTKE